MPYSPSPATVSVSPSDPAGQTSASYVMGGLGVAGANAWTITPQVTGRVLVMVMGDITQSNTATTGTVQLSYGTGTAPALNAAVTGTQIGGQVFFTGLTGCLTAPFALMAVVTGLAIPTINSVGQTTAGTPVWFDVAMKSSANSITISKMTCTAIEL